VADSRFLQLIDRGAVPRLALGVGHHDPQRHVRSVADRAPDVDRGAVLGVEAVGEDVVAGSVEALVGVRPADDRVVVQLRRSGVPVLAAHGAPESFDGVHQRIVTTILPSLPPAAKRS
jgi:hypothetical protein